MLVASSLWSGGPQGCRRERTQRARRMGWTTARRPPPSRRSHQRRTSGVTVSSSTGTRREAGISDRPGRATLSITEVAITVRRPESTTSSVQHRQRVRTSPTPVSQLHQRSQDRHCPVNPYQCAIVSPMRCVWRWLSALDGLKVIVVSILPPLHREKARVVVHPVVSMLERKVIM